MWLCPVPLAFVTPEWVAPQLTPALLLSVGLPRSSSSPWPRRTLRFATLQASGYTVPVSRTDRRLRGLGTIAGAVWGLFHSPHRGDHRRHMPEPGGAPDPKPALAGGHSRGRFLSAGRSVRRVNHRPDVGPCRRRDPDAGGSGAARHHRRESVSGGIRPGTRCGGVNFVTASGVTLWELAPPSRGARRGELCYPRCAVRSWEGASQAVLTRWLKWLGS